MFLFINSFRLFTVFFIIKSLYNLYVVSIYTRANAFSINVWCSFSFFFFYKEVDCKRAFFGVRIRGRRLRDSSITTRLRVMFSLHASVQYHDSSPSSTLLLISLWKHCWWNDLGQPSQKISRLFCHDSFFWQTEQYNWRIGRVRFARGSFKYSVRSNLGSLQANP